MITTARTKGKDKGAIKIKKLLARLQAEIRKKNNEHIKN